ncbi:MAG TPA: acyl-CoA dehydrogenase family protein [Streptosporangiaceae bacterium]|nr:acyl-CoA dehydrogenase family protein [Streptosporangiaceae bacterium]
MSTNADARESRAVAEAARQEDWTLPSFGKGLFLGELRLDLLYPQPRMADEDVVKGERFIATMRDFLVENVDPQAIEDDGRIPDGIVDGLRKIGALGMRIPERYGGLGLSQVYYNRVMMLIGSWHTSLAILLSAHQSIGAPQPLLYFGSEQQKDYWLPRVCEHLSAFALTEPGVGSDPARMTTRAVPTEDGSGYRISGRKLWTTNGTVADVMVVLAKVPRGEGHKGGITAFIVPRDSDGIVVESRNEFMGARGIENSLTSYTDVFVPAENVIGKEGAGLKIALTTLNTGRMAIPAQCAGMAKWATKVAREFAGARVQWGKPIGQHDEVAQRIGTIAATAFALEAMLDVTSRMADEKRNDVRIEAALAKLYTTEMGWRVIDDLMQVCGGRGYETAASLKARGVRGVPVEQAMRDMRGHRITEGSTEIMHLLVAREAVDQHLSVAGGLIEEGVPLREKGKVLTQAGRFYGQWYPKLAVGAGQNPSAYRDFGPLAGHLRYVERASRKLARATFYGMARWRGETENKGKFLGRLVDIGAELYAICATVVHASTLGVEQPGQAEASRQLADVFCAQSRHRVEGLFHDLWHNADSATYALAQDVLGGRYTWLEEDILDPSGDGPMVPDSGPPSPAATAAHPS